MKIWAQLDIRNLVKNYPVLQVRSWICGGQGSWFVLKSFSLRLLNWTLELDFWLRLGLGLGLWQLFNSCVCTQILDCSQWETRGLNIILICYKNIARSLWQVFRIVMSPALCLLMRIFPWRRRSGAVTRCITWADTSTTISYYTDTFYLTFTPQTYSSSLWRQSPL